MGDWDRARFYEVDGEQYPSVTTVLDIISKPALGPWYAREERKYLLAAMGEALRAKVPHKKILALIAELAKEKKAADRAKDKAANIGTQVHKMIEYTIRRQLKLKVEERPAMSEAALRVFKSWERWWKRSKIRPLKIETRVHCVGCGYAGTMDLLAEQNGKAVVLDWKTSKGIYWEMLLQNIAYRHACRKMGIKTYGGILVRIPKTEDESEVEIHPVKKGEVSFDAFKHALGLWRKQRAHEGREAGVVPKGECK